MGVSVPSRDAADFLNDFETDLECDFDLEPDFDFDFDLDFLFSRYFYLIFDNFSIERILYFLSFSFCLFNRFILSLRVKDGRCYSSILGKGSTVFSLLN
jgi:hypothetical protein